MIINFMLMDMPVLVKGVSITNSDGTITIVKNSRKEVLWGSTRKEPMEDIHVK